MIGSVNQKDIFTTLKALNISRSHPISIALPFEPKFSTQQDYESFDYYLNMWQSNLEAIYGFYHVLITMFKYDQVEAPVQNLYGYSLQKDNLEMTFEEMEEAGLRVTYL